MPASPAIGAGILLGELEEVAAPSVAVFAGRGLCPQTPEEREQSTARGNAGCRRQRRSRPQGPARGRGSFAAASLPSSGPASVRDSWPSAGNGVRDRSGICRSQSDDRGSSGDPLPGKARPRQNCLSEAAMKIKTRHFWVKEPRHRRPSQHHQRGQPPASPRRGNVPI